MGLESTAARSQHVAQDVADDVADDVAPPAASCLPTRPLTVLVAVPAIEVGAADEGAVDLAATLAGAGHHPIVVSSGGRLEPRLAATGAEFIRLDMASRNPSVIARNAAALFRLLRQRRCDLVHAHGRAAAWSAFAAARMAGTPFLTSWYKGFRQQNVLKRLYNGVMARGERVIAPSDQIAELIVARHHVPWERIAVIPPAVDLGRFDPAALTHERIEAVRHGWGIKDDQTRVVLIPGRMLRRKGHHVVVQAARRLKDMGVANVVFVFAGEDQGRSRYNGELWDLVLATDTADIVRMAGAPTDMPAAYGAAAAVVSAAIQPEGLQRTILEALGMARPVVVSDLAAGPDIVLAPPTVPEERMTGLRFAAGDADGLARALIRLLSMPEAARRAIGRRGREWVAGHCAPATIAREWLAVYAAVSQNHR